jgi:serine/threonine protein kinase
VIRKIGLLTEKDAKFYTCCLMLVLEYLHKKKIVYRDLKPENVMIDDFGYPNLIDFGAARRVVGKTYTFIGTSFYIAPEVVKGEGYSNQVDHWSLGIMLYEFIFGVVPFGETETDSYKIFHEIINSPLKFPENCGVKVQTRNFIKGLLEKNPFHRIADPLSHEWLKDTDWDALVNKKFKSPYIPKISDLVWVDSKAKSLTEGISSDLGEDWDDEFNWNV